jgi:DNA replication ATP-dependent helicase Dna2
MPEQRAPDHLPGDWLEDGRLRLDEILGEGAFGHVWRATEFIGFGPDGAPIELRQVAVKCLSSLDDSAAGDRIVDEARALAGLNHDAILKLHRAFTDDRGTYLVTEFATEGDLRGYFDYAIPTEPELRDIAFAVGSGLSYLHERGYLHGDLKPENVLATVAGDRVRYMLADFGLRSATGHRHFQGTVPYIAPEAYSPHAASLTDRSDVFAYGLFLFEIASGHRLMAHLQDERFEALRTHSVDVDVLRDAHAIVDDVIQGTDWTALQLPSFLTTLIRFCLDPDPRKRPSAWTVMELWAAFERTQRGAILPYTSAGVGDGRYQVPCSQLVTVGEDESDEDGVVAHLTGEGGALIQVEVSRQVNRPMHDALTRLQRRLDDRPPVVSVYGIVPEDVAAMRFRADRRSFVVVEPHELLDVTDLSRSHHCVRAYLHRMVGADGGSSKALVKGNILHALFAEMLLDEDVDFDEAWTRQWQSRATDIAHVVQDADELAGLRRDIKAAYERVRNVLIREPAWLTPQRYVESSRWSFDLGLSGRIDAFFLSDGGRASAYELKTGRVRPDDLLQVQAYVAMLSDDLDRQAEADDRSRLRPTVRAQILTSSDGRLHPVGTVAPHAKLSAIRNQILGLRDQLTEGRSASDMLPTDYPFFGYQQAKCDRCASAYSYLSRACRQSTSLFRERVDIEGSPATPTELEYFWHGIRLIMREEGELRRQHVYPLMLAPWLDGQSGAPARRRSSPDRRVEDASLVAHEGSRFRFEYPPSIAEFRVGDDVVIHRGDLRRWHEVLRATVRDMSETSVTVEARSDYTARGFASTPDGWVVEYFPRFFGLDTLRRALHIFLTSPNQAMKSLVLEGRIPRRQGALFPSEPELDLAPGRRLNSEQRGALLRALDETGFLSITGPPGTGKTMTIHAIVDTYARRSARVLVAALTNNAIDNVIERLLGDTVPDGVEFVRLGAGSRMRDVFGTRLEEMGRDPRMYFARELGEACDDPAQVRARLEETPIVVGTAHSILREPWIAALAADEPPFDLVIVDEATQAPEPLAAALLTLGRKAILVGDERQLGPISVSSFDPDRQDIPESLRDIGVAGLDRSLFERLNALLRKRGDEQALVFLSRQYRMHPIIGRWASEQFYEGRLTTAAGSDALVPALAKSANQAGWDVLARILAPDTPLVFLDVPAAGGDVPNTCAEEARMAALIVQALRALGIEDVGCITPYRNQQALMRRELASAGTPVECGTVDAFQGREKDVMLLSTVRRDKLTDFLADPRRLNVSVTRARAKCIIMGARAVLHDSPAMASLVNHPDCLRERVAVADIAAELGVT